MGVQWRFICHMYVDGLTCSIAKFDGDKSQSKLEFLQSKLNINTIFNLSIN